MKMRMWVAVVVVVVCGLSLNASAGYEDLEPKAFDKAYWCYKGIIMGTAFCTAMLNIPYGFWVRDNQKLATEITLEPHKSEAATIFGLSVAGAVMNGVATLSSAPLLAVTLLRNPLDPTGRAAKIVFALQVGLIVDFAANVAVQIADGVLIYRLRDELAQNPPQALTTGLTVPLWFANTALTGLTALMAVPALGFQLKAHLRAAS